QPGRVDRVHRAVLAVVAEHPTDAKAAAASVEAALEWTRRQWPPRQSAALGQAWTQAREAPAPGDQGLLALEVYSLWLLEVRQRCRAMSATGTVA
ncbi:MAG: hypothetical protein ACRD1K_14295, partial [Acidimicrobiales bacterium]